MEVPCEPRDYARAAGYAVVGMALVAALWVTLVAGLGGNWGFVALFMGLAAGVGVRAAARGRAAPGLGCLGAALGVLGVVMGLALANDALLAGGNLGGWLLRFPFVLIGTLISLVLHPWMLLLVALAAWQGWSLAPRGTRIPADLKQRLLAQMPETLEFGQAYPDEFPQLDRARLGEWTEALQELGFEWAQDYRPAHAQPGAPVGMARLFLHPNERCYAELGQVFPPGGPARPLFCSVVSLVGREEAVEWQLATSTAPADSVAWMLRRPDSLWSRHPEAAPADLLPLHLGRRAELLAGRGGEPLPVSSGAFFSQLQREVLARRERLQALPVADIVRAGRRQEIPSEWLSPGGP